MAEENEDQGLVKAFGKLLNLVVFLLLVILGLFTALIYTNSSKQKKSVVTAIERSFVVENSGSQNLNPVIDTTYYWNAPDEANLATDPKKERVLYGKELIAHTSIYFGPKGTISKESTNGMNCQNCHLNAGTKVFGNNYSAVATTYPKYRARSGTKEDIPKRVNDCFERSLNGKTLKIDSKEMQSIIAYLKWLGKDVPAGKKPAGSGFQQIAYLERAADPEKGKLVYVQKCQSCHQQSGEGLMNSDGTAFTYPPLWGDHSYNNGAGLYRLSNFARFVKYNMPMGASHTNVQLSDEEAWDVAAFVNSQPRPKKDLKKDWPKIEEKPFDHPYGPYADSFSESQHKNGPYQPILDASAKTKKK